MIFHKRKVYCTSFSFWQMNENILTYKMLYGTYHVVWYIMFILKFRLVSSQKSVSLSEMKFRIILVFVLNNKKLKWFQSYCNEVSMWYGNFLKRLRWNHTILNFLHTRMHTHINVIHTHTDIHIHIQVYIYIYIYIYLYIW